MYIYVCVCVHRHLNLKRPRRQRHRRADVRVQGHSRRPNFRTSTFRAPTPNSKNQRSKPTGLRLLKPEVSPQATTLES